MSRPTNADQPVPSVTSLWPVAGWLEREVYDMYGVLFDGNPDLRRILTDYGFQRPSAAQGFPAHRLSSNCATRKRPSASCTSRCSLAQDFRTFDFT